MTIGLMRTAALGICAATVVGLSGAVTAGADTVIPLKPKTTVVKLPSGGSVTISSRGEQAKLSPGMVALPSTRNAWVSGAISVKIDGQGDGGSIEAGYAIGCQVEIQTASVEAGASLNGPTFGPDAAGPSVTGTTGGSIGIGAGQIGTQSLPFDRATFPKPGDEIKPNWASPSNSFNFEGSSGGFSYSDQTIGVDGCGGYAQARLYVIVSAGAGNSQTTAILWGDRFTLG